MYSCRHFPYRVILSLFLAASYHSLYAQEFAKHWIFNTFSLTFDKDSVTAVQNDLSDFRSNGYASICDASGRLVLYSNSFMAWNSNDELIENGDSLLIPGTEGTSNLLSLIVPAPGNVNRYYIFIVNPYNGNTAAGLYYAEADMAANNGKGGIIRKRVRLSDSTTGNLTALYHANRHDVWIITHRTYSNSYYAFRVSDAGVSETPVISTLGKIHDSYNGQLKGSPDGKKIAVSYDTWSNGEGFDLFDFDNETGTLSNAKSFVLPQRGCRGLEFSPDATKLYVYQYGSTGESGLYQFNVKTNIKDSIDRSRQLILQDRVNGFETMQLGPNGVIFIAKGGGGYDGALYLATIKKPDEPGTNCETLEKGLFLNGGFGGGVLFPNFIQDYFFKTNYTVSGLCSGDSTSFNISNTTRIDSVSWNFGDNTGSTKWSPRHIYSTAGNYIAHLIVHYPDKTDTIYKSIRINPVPDVFLGIDTTVCSGHQFRLKENYAGINWHNGTHLKYFSATGSGKYWVRVSNQFQCVNSDTINVLVNPSPLVNIGNDTTICDNSRIILNAGNQNSGLDLLWNTGSKESNITVSSEGSYWLAVTNGYHCTTRDIINISTRPAPPVNLGKDTIITGFNLLYLDAGFYGYPTNYVWNDNYSFQYKSFGGSNYLPGQYPLSVNVTAPNRCIGQDTILITIIQDFQYYNACFGKVTGFALGSPGRVDSVLWDFGDGSLSRQLYASHNYEASGEYLVTATLFSGQKTETLQKEIQIVPFPEVNLGGDIIIEYNSLLTLDAGNYEVPVYYRWDDNSGNQFRYIRGNDLQSGVNVFFVKVTTQQNYCVSADTIIVRLDPGTNTGELPAPSAIRCFPNPAGKILYVENPEETNDLRAVLCDASGQVIDLWQLLEGIAGYDISELNPGIYILHIYRGNMCLTKFKIIKT